MAQAVVVRSKEWLEACKAVDTTPRPIRATEYIDLHCYLCGSVGPVKVGNADHSLKTKGYARCCHECKKKTLSEYAKGRIGEKNSFYGKNHSKETKETISKKQKVRLSRVSPEIRREIAMIGYKAAVEKYGGNPMCNEEVRKKHYEATHTKEFIEEATKRGCAVVDERFVQKMRAASKAFWGDDPNDEKRSRQRESFCIRQKDHPDWEKSRLAGLAEYLADEERVRTTWEKIRATCVDRYGVENWQHSKDAETRAKTFSSRAELEILTWVRSLGLAAYKHRIGSHELDIYVPDKQIGIEYNGLYWHSEIQKGRLYHREKSDFFKSHGIRVIHVFEHIWRDRQMQIKSYLRSALGCNQYRVGARKCFLREVSRQEAVDFLEKTHIQGAPPDIKLALGLCYGERLVCLATFGRHHRGMGNSFVLNRFVGADGWTVSGGLSRLSREAAFRLGRLITWADLSLSDGMGYVRAGWRIDAVFGPDYFYTDFIDVFSKQSRRKVAVDTPNGMTERQHALLDGLFRVYDCGKLRLLFENLS